MIRRIIDAADQVSREKRLAQPSSLDGYVSTYSPEVTVVAMGFDLYRPFMADAEYSHVYQGESSTSAYPGHRRYLRFPGVNTLFTFDRDIPGDEVWFFVQDLNGSGRWESLPKPHRSSPT